ncbi:hypothetical protein [Bradyrhizobium genosp. A]|uniref:hypothetical protein n=1 Tax=Bradyrhizobium genosp. A TaxID=83626 RepID=UPI003CF716E6
MSKNSSIIGTSAKRIDVAATWDKLLRIRRLGVDKFSKYALVLIPIVASCVLVANKHGLAIQLPVFLLKIYAATFLFYIGSTLVDIFGPEEVKEYHTYERYSESCLNEILRVSDAMANRQTEDEAQTKELRGAMGAEGATDNDHLVGALERLSIAEVRRFFEDDTPSRWNQAIHSNSLARALAAASFVGSACIGFYAAAIEAPLHVILSAI